MRVLAFDVFGTVLDLSGVPCEELRSYAAQLKQDPWKGLLLPNSWRSLPAHPDAKEGLERLRKKFICVTLSNGPLPLLARAINHNKLSFDAIIPIECAEVYKPNPKAYAFAADLLCVDETMVTMVTANPGFGDVEAARACGMQAQVIRHADDTEFPEWKGCPKDLIALAELYGC